MTQELLELRLERGGVLSVVAFAGGKIDGRCIQLTIESDSFCQLTKSEVERLMMVLALWEVGAISDVAQAE